MSPENDNNDYNSGVFSSQTSNIGAPRQKDMNTLKAAPNTVKAMNKNMFGSQ